jgi:hypothetical protein
MLANLASTGMVGMPNELVFVPEIHIGHCQLHTWQKENQRIGNPLQ